MGLTNPTFLLSAIFLLSTYSYSWSQNRNLSTTSNENCYGSKMTYLGIEMTYPITVSEAKIKYDLEYKPNYLFCKTIASLPVLSKYAQYNFNLIFPTNRIFIKDNIPEKEFSKEQVKGYTFTFRGSTDTDSLIIALEKQFGGKFIKKENRATKALKMNRGLFYYEMKLSDCLHVAVSDYGPQKALVWVSFYFDILEKEREWFPH